MCTVRCTCIHVVQYSASMHHVQCIMYSASCTPVSCCVHHVHLSVNCAHRCCLCQTVCLLVCLPACLPACLPYCLSACLSVCLSVCCLPLQLHNVFAFVCTSCCSNYSKGRASGVVAVAQVVAAQGSYWIAQPRTAPTQKTAPPRASWTWACLRCPWTTACPPGQQC